MLANLVHQINERGGINLDELDAGVLDQLMDTQLFEHDGKRLSCIPSCCLYSRSTLVDIDNHIIPVEYLISVDSTNSYLSRELKSAHSPARKAVITEVQTQSRGRRGKAWVAAPGQNITLSLAWPIVGGFNALGPLSLAVGYWVALALKKHGFNTQLKWPNDIYLDGKKLAGILVELEQVNDQLIPVIGLGLNLVSPHGVDQPTAALASCDKSDLLKSILTEIVKGLSVWHESSFESMRPLWLEYALWLNETVELSSGSHSRRGVLRSITSTGALIVEVNGHNEVFNAGELSLRSIL